ncbi:MAG: ERAP1-like C-terminal domain-containing protein [Vicinamibacterales bacterium]
MRWRPSAIRPRSSARWRSRCPTTPRSQDTPTLLGQLLGGTEGDLAWTVVTREWQAIADKVGVFQGVPSIVGALGGFCSTDKSREIAAFFAAHPTPAAARSLQQALERIDSCAAVQTRQAPAFAAWMQKQG